MRIYMNAVEAIEEIKRDLMEMGIEVKPRTYQDKVIEGNPDYYTKELQNYCYTILDCKSSEVPGVSQPWADEEFEERIVDPYWEDPVSGKAIDPRYINPGYAYKHRTEVWNEFLEADGKFGYTYNERLWFNDQFTKVVNHLKKDPDSRQLWISLWNPNIDPDNIGGSHRVPCSLGYGIQVREGKVHLHYVMRSSDFATHFNNDIYLAMKLLEHISRETGYPVGNFTHTMFSLHVYNKDIKGVF